jgi:hypothetical protein
MSKAIRRKESKRKVSRDEHLPLTRQNFMIIGIGIIVIIAGYMAMLEGSVEGFMPLVVAPILLVIGYCIIIPLGILYKKSYIKAEGSELNQMPKET